MQLLNGHPFAAVASKFPPDIYFVWSFPVENVGDHDVVLDDLTIGPSDVTLDDLTIGPSLQVIAKEAIPASKVGVLLPVQPVDPHTVQAMMDWPLAGATIGRVKAVGWTGGAWISVLMQAQAPGSFEVGGVVLTYHDGSQTYSTRLPATLVVCAGPVASGEVPCPSPVTGP